jgi:AsmA protein
MKRMIKILLALAGALVLLLVLAAVVLPLVYDKQDLKQAIAGEVGKQTGRELRIDGALQFSVFPWLAVEVGDLSLSDATGFGDQPMAHIGKARVGVALLPLFSKQLVADEITLDGVQLFLAVDGRGRNNWDDLARQGDVDTAETATESQAGPFASRRIAGLNVLNAQVEYQDAQAGTHYRLSDVSVHTGALGDSQPVALELEMLLQDLVGGTRLDVDLAATARIDLEAESYALDDVELSLTPLAGDGAAGPPGASSAVIIRTPRLEANLAAQTLAADTISASLAGLQAEGALQARKILDQPSFEGTLRIAEFSPRKVLQALAMQSPATTDPDVLQKAQLSATVKGDSKQLALNDLRLELDQSLFSGTLSVRHFDRPGIRFDCSVDAIDLDRYLAPAADQGATSTDVAMPEKELRGLDLQGTLRVAALQLAGVKFSDAVVGINLGDGKLHISPLTAGFYDGRYSGDVTLDSSGAVPQLSLDEKIDSITFQRLVADITANENLSGTAHGHVRLTGSGATSSAVLGSLQGDLGLTLDEGALEGVNIWHELKRGYALYKGLPSPAPEPERTVFSHLQIDAVVDQGVVTTRELIGELPFLALRGNGHVDLAKSVLDLRLTATVRNTPELSGDPLAADLKGRQLPFKVSGPLEAPKVSVDWAALLTSEATGALLDKLGLKPQAEPSAAAGDDAPQKSSKEQTREAAKGMLFDLLKGKDKKKDPQEGQDGNG